METKSSTRSDLTINGDGAHGLNQKITAPLSKSAPRLNQLLPCTNLQHLLCNQLNKHLAFSLTQSKRRAVDFDLLPLLADAIIVLLLHQYRLLRLLLTVVLSPLVSSPSVVDATWRQFLDQYIHQLLFSVPHHVLTVALNPLTCNLCAVDVTILLLNRHQCNLHQYNLHQCNPLQLTAALNPLICNQCAADVTWLLNRHQCNQPQLTAALNLLLCSLFAVDATWLQHQFSLFQFSLLQLTAALSLPICNQCAVDATWPQHRPQYQHQHQFSLLQ